MKAVLSCCFLAVCSLVAGVVVSRPAAAAVPPSRIVFAANELPRWYGEIYRVTPDGVRIDLTQSPAPDIAPSVSPDGRWVAFLSGRGGRSAFYVVGTDGRGLRRISPLLSQTSEGEFASIVWAPNSRNLAAEIDGEKPVLYLGSPAGGLRVFAQNVVVFGGELATLAWSPDGRMLAYSTNDLLNGGQVRVVSAEGQKLWSVVGWVVGNAWSADDRLAVAASDHTGNETTGKVYDSRGRRLTTFPSPQPPVWSPDGKLLASTSPYAVQIRRDGVGAPIFRWPARNAVTLQWIDSSKLRFQGQNGWVGLDVARRSAWDQIDPTTPYNSVISASGQVLAEQQQSDNSSKLLLSSVGSTSTTTIATGPWCPDNGDFSNLAFMPRGLGIIYQTNCMTPSRDIYSINPDGTGLRQLTNTPTDEIEPSLSADGQNIVYVQQLTAGRCDGCAQTLWRVSANGGTPQQLTSHADDEPAPFDENPSWSPDGSEIAFQNSGANSPLRLLTMPATGGSPQDLHAKGAALPIWGPQQIAFADWSVPKRVVKTINPATGQIRVAATKGRPDVEAIAWSNSGRLAYLYTDAHNHTVVATVGSTAKPLDLSAHLLPHARVTGLAWSPDGTRFAFAATDTNGIGEIYTIATNGQHLRQLTRNIGAADNINYESTLTWR